jgi:hypothetical protein
MQEIAKILYRNTKKMFDEVDTNAEKATLSLLLEELEVILLLKPVGHETPHLHALLRFFEKTGLCSDDLCFAGMVDNGMERTYQMCHLSTGLQFPILIEQGKETITVGILYTF